MTRPPLPGKVSKGVVVVGYLPFRHLKKIFKKFGFCIFYAYLCRMEKETPRQKFERELKEKQTAHLEGVRKRLEDNWTPCLHDQCTECFGTSIKRDGTACSHYLVCNCPKCSTSLGKAYGPFRSFPKPNSY